MPDTWPPAISPDDTWHYREVRGAAGGFSRADREQRRLRVVRLWGRDELYDDETNRVFCVGCAELVDLETLCTPGNGHPVSPVGSSQHIFLGAMEAEHA